MVAIHIKEKESSNPNILINKVTGRGSDWHEHCIAGLPDSDAYQPSERNRQWHRKIFMINECKRPG